MTILAGDIKLLASAVMDDVPEGGGAPTATVIQDGASNGVFPDISELDRAGGRVNLRKVFAGVRTVNTDGYYGANVIVAEPYADPRVSVTLFSTGDTFDRRDDAAGRMESYLAKGPSYPGYLFGDHLAGQMSVTLLQRIEVAPPVIGDTLVLRKNEGLSTQFDQFIRVTSVSTSERVFTDSQGDFNRLQVNLGISDVLQEDFNGFDALRLDSSINYTGKTKTSSTIVADAARYYGVVPVEIAASLGAYSVKTEGIYTQLVPSTRQEIGIADARMNQQSSALVKAGDAYSRSITMTFTTGSAMFVGGSILPGSLSVARGGITLTDKGGTLIDAASDQVGTIDYSNGVLSLSTNVFGTSGETHAVSYIPAAAPAMVGESVSELVTSASQRLNYNFTLFPPPARGTLVVSFRALGRWYDLREDGTGALRGADSSFGAGTLNYSTGTVSVTLGALPDVDSSVISTFVAAAISRPIEEIANSGPALPRRFGKPVSLGKAIKPGTLTITWNDGTARTATDSGGVLTGDATGVVNYAEGFIDIRPNLLPAKNTAITIAITEAAQSKSNIPLLTDSGANWTCTLPTPLKAGTVELSVVGGQTQYLFNGIVSTAVVNRRSIRVTDNGSGTLQLAGAGGALFTCGTVDYSTGAVVLFKTVSGWQYDAPVNSWDSVSGRPFFGGYTTVTTSLTVTNGPEGAQLETEPWAWWTGSQGNAVEVRAAAADAPVFSGSSLFDYIFLPSNPAGFGATTNYAADISSLFLGSTLIASKPGGLYQADPSPTTGVGTEVGSKSTIGGMSGVMLTQWTAGVSSAPTGVAGASQSPTSGSDSLFYVDRVSFRTAVSPLVNSGLQVAGTWIVTGDTFTATASSDGSIATGTAVVGETPGSYGVFGRVDYEMGVINLHFGRRVPASMAANDYVLDLTYLGLAGVQYVESYPASADTLRYNATGYSYLPLDPDILGLNPVRLPADGRVPIFRSGTFAVMGHTGIVGPSTVSNGQVINAGRTRLSRWRVVGNDGLVIDTGYTQDLDAGTLTVTDITGWSQPATFEHRIEDMMLVSDAQINGQVTFTRPLTHDYPLGSYLSSAMVAGDVRARTSLVFDQVTWTNVWSDSQIGDNATGTFNDTAYPITVTNLGALTERWAVKFLSSSSFQVIGEHVGVIATGDINTTCAPMNPGTGQPYFTIPTAGWGTGWSTGNVLRFNTIGALVPIWVARTILAGPETVTDDDFTLLLRGDVDTP